MVTFKIKNLSFTYALSNEKALKGISLNIQNGEFVLICGGSGCGKTTLLRCLKKELTPHGQKSGSISYRGKGLDAASPFEIGFVMQNPDSQIVTDRVWHELAMGLEYMGLESYDI